MSRGWVVPATMAVAVLVSISFSKNAGAQACEPAVGTLVSVEGAVEIQRAGQTRWNPAGVNETLCERDTVRTGRNSRATAALINDAVLRLDQNTTVNLVEIAPQPEEKSLLDLIAGAFQSFSRKPRELSVSTPYLNATIEGTEFVIRVAQAETRLTVFEGVVRAANPQGEASAASGQMVVAQAGQAPVQRVVVRPRDAAQWSLYYPPLLAAVGGPGGAPPAGLPAAMAEALALAGGGRSGAALDAMERVPVTSRDARWHLYRAAFLLAAGRVGEAGAAIDEALRRDSGSGLAYAQRAVIDVARNRREEALRNAERAVELSPDSTAARIAHSYALQAHYRLAEAAATLEAAVAANPDDALAHARLAELWMMNGYRGRARDAAERAAELQPELARIQVVLGYAALIEIRTTQARAAFEKAIAIDSDDPMPHLGLGLAMIRQGELAAGRGRIEVAVGLDSENALLRSYLGKGYFEEKRDPLDGEQLAIAKQLDPLDPTPWLYDAIRKQSENQPGAALADLQKSIELNDNRAVYRGRLQLDEDRAARGASLARVYNDLGFEQQGLREATKSLADDPTNASAHRFLSDSYAGIRRREISRVSEQLQAQLLQDVNINPVSPSASETNLNIGSGAASAGFNEYTALFERNQAQFNASGGYGTDDTWMGEGVVSGVYEWFSISAGGYHYETDGWRANNDIEHDIQNAYVQAALTPEINLQAEYRKRDTAFGDLEFEFDRDDFFTDIRNTEEQEIARLGLHYKPRPDTDALVSYIYNRREGLGSESFFDPFIPALVGIDEPFEQDTHQVEMQVIHRRDWFNVVAGLGYASVDSDSSVDVSFDGVPAFSIPLSSEVDDYRGYVYTNIEMPRNLTWTLGLSYVDFDEESAPDNKLDRFNPKVGVQWDVTPQVRLRAAYIETVKPALAANRTLEPTQVAGFNQFFDDANAVISKRYGFGADWQVTPVLTVGAEATWRDVEQPILDELNFPPPGKLIDTDAQEETHQAYINWLPIDGLALRTGVVYDRFDFQSRAFAASVQAQFPLEAETISVPVTVSYFHPSGLFAVGDFAYVKQDVERLAFFTNQGDDSFTVVNLGVGYRLPRRMGIASIWVNNVFESDFSYQDDSYREFGTEPSIGPYFPERTILGRLTLNF